MSVAKQIYISLAKSVFGYLEKYDDLKKFSKLIESGTLLNRDRLYLEVNMIAYRNLCICLLLGMLGLMSVLEVVSLNQSIKNIAEGILFTGSIVFLLRYHNKRWSRTDFKMIKQDPETFRTWVNEFPEIKPFVTKNKVFEKCGYIDYCLMYMFVTSKAQA